LILVANWTGHRNPSVDRALSNGKDYDFCGSSCYQ
jgi:hypothetical protein